MPLSRLGSGSLQSNTVGSLQIVDGQIVEADLADGSVTAAKLASGAVLTRLTVGTRTTNIDVNIANGTLTVTGRTGDISVGVS
jgi:hypothetical protein